MSDYLLSFISFCNFRGNQPESGDDKSWVPPISHVTQRYVPTPQCPRARHRYGQISAPPPHRPWQSKS